MSRDDYVNWIGRTETVHDDMAATQTLAAAATFDDGNVMRDTIVAIPPLWHWFYFLPRAPQSQLADDGHPERGGFMPPVLLPRRMFAGSRVVIYAPLQLRIPARRDGIIKNVTVKDGKSGRLVFVTVGYSFWQQGTHCLEEEQDIVYREAGTPALRIEPVTLPAAPTHAWTRDVIPDPRLLFRFSALTFNAHRIHYDREYATQVEGYPGLVVHGPLTAVLLANLVRAHTTREITRFSFRGAAPLFDVAPFRLVATQRGDTVTCEALAPDGIIALHAEALLNPQTVAR